ncbi:MAG: hypothetical protein ACI96P_001450, partial [Candidatus Azotimanducaceae bacterium]
MFGLHELRLAGLVQDQWLPAAIESLGVTPNRLISF